ncbi:MAG: maleylpyruvate isomerase family mycothiol-dependent enzyme [Acidimicrobiia bacterium]
MDASTHLTHLENYAVLLGANARAAGVDAAVPSCPGWTVGELVAHTSVVHRHKTAIVAGQLVEESAPIPARPDGDVLEWYDEGVAEMMATFANADLSLPTWTWCDHQHAAEWWVRRMAHETAIHGADAVLANDGVASVDDALAEDGVDELLDEMMVGGPVWSTVDHGDRRIDLVAGDRRWSLRTASFSGTAPGSGEQYESIATVVFDDAGKPDAVVGTDGGTLDLWLWGRGPLGVEDTSGDADLVSHLRGIAADVTQ